MERRFLPNIQASLQVLKTTDNFSEAEAEYLDKLISSFIFLTTGNQLAGFLDKQIELESIIQQQLLQSLQELNTLSDDGAIN